MFVVVRSALRRGPRVAAAAPLTRVLARALVRPYSSPATGQDALRLFGVLSGQSKCLGCGTKFQTTDSTQPGFLHAARLQASLDALQGAPTPPPAAPAPTDAGTPPPSATGLARGGRGRVVDAKAQQAMLSDLMSVVASLPATHPVRQSLPADASSMELYNRDAAKDAAASGASGAGGERAAATTLSATTKPSSLVCSWCHGLRYQNKTAHRPSPSPASIQESVDSVLGDPMKTDLSKNFAPVAAVVVDLTDVSASLCPAVVAAVAGHTVVLVGNKVDVLPPDARKFEERLKAWLRRQAKGRGIANVAQVFLVSATSGTGVNELAVSIRRAMVTGGVGGEDEARRGRRQRSVVMVGATNSGKSSLLKVLVPKLLRNKRKRATVGKVLSNIKERREQERLARGEGEEGEEEEEGGEAEEEEEEDVEVGGHSNEQLSEADVALLRQAHALTTSHMSNTTQSVIHFRISPWDTLVDTPGLQPPAHLSLALPASEHRVVAYRKHAQPGFVFLKEGKSIIVGGLLRIDHVQGPHIMLVGHVSPHVPLHSLSTSQAEAKWERHAGKLFAPPSGDFAVALGRAWVPVELELEGGGKFGRAPMDLVFPGVGWMGCSGPGRVLVRVWAPPCIDVHLREALLPFEPRKARTYHKRVLKPKKSVRADRAERG